MNRNQFIVILSLLCFCSLVTAQPDVNMPSEPGLCYAKCLIPIVYEKWSDWYPVYIGNPLYEEVDLDTVIVEYMPAGEVWEKRRSNENCPSEDPNDCIIWCLVEVPEKIEFITVLRDTTQSVNYDWTEVEGKIWIDEGGTTEWREVVCDSDITPRLYKRVQSALIDKGYVLGSSGADGNAGPATKAALVKFQRDHDLPIGQLDFQTLDALNIKI